MDARRKNGLERFLTTTTGLIDLTSNDYLGFAKEQQLMMSSNKGATGSRLLTGNSTEYEALETKIADYHRSESCLIFNSGYTANLGLISSLGSDESIFLYDTEIHASMHDGMRLANGKSYPFRHNDLCALEARLKRVGRPCYVLVESIYSISGTLAPLKEMTELCSKYAAYLIVDEAHATGIRGVHGEGLVGELGLEQSVFARIHTFSKSLGTHGGAVLGSKKLREYLVNFSRPLIYSTALPSITLESINAAYDKLKKVVSCKQDQLNELIRYFQFKTGSKLNGPIQPIYIESVDQVRKIVLRLQQHGLDVRALVSPTTPKGRECLRFVLHSFNKKEEIDQLWEIASL